MPKQRNSPYLLRSGCVRLLSIAAALFLFFGALLTGANYFGIAQACRTRVGFSCIPILGGLLGCAGFLMLLTVRTCAFITPFVEPGCLPTMLAVVVHIIRQKSSSFR